MSDKTEQMLQVLIDGQDEIRESVKRLHGRLDETAKETTINSQKIEFLEKGQAESKATCKEEREIIWRKMHEHKKDAIITSVKNVKIWLYGAFFLGGGGLITSLVVAYLSTTFTK